jgi:citrate lyase subunit beta/citryl-CoA lyase
MRALLFVPGDRPERFDKALASGADAVIIDLEDAVDRSRKGIAREAVRAWLHPSRAVIVRVNGPDTPWFAEDLALAAIPGVDAVMLPKAERADTLSILATAGTRAILPLIETAAGFAEIGNIAGAWGVQRLVFGSIDLRLDLGFREALEDDLLPFRLQMVLASRVAGIAPPIDGVTMAINDEAQLRIDAQRARRLGFGGKLCIHPRQVAPVRGAFAPSAAEISWAQSILAVAAANPSGAFAVNGEMVDKPVLLRAQAILHDAGVTNAADARQS